jgi:dCMP deaminase
MTWDDRDPRPGWDEYFLGIAKSVATRADCTRRRVGSVIADTDNRIIATGYNGGPSGGPSCLKGECPRGLHYPHPAQKGVCICGRVLPDGLKGACVNGVEHGSSYDTGAGSCIAVHAEANALLYARTSVKGFTLYCTELPCDGCDRLIKGAGIARIVCPTYEWEQPTC